MKSLLTALLLALSSLCAAQPQAPADKPPHLDALVALARTYGVVRYFHPSDSLDAVKWDRFLVHAASRMGSITRDDEIAPRLEELFAPVVEGFRVATAGAALQSPPAGDGAVVEWRHLGYGLEPDPSVPYASWRTHHQPIGVGRDQGSFEQHRVAALKPVHAEPVYRVKLPRALEAHVAVSLPMSAVKVTAAQRARLDALQATLAAVEPTGDPVDRARAHADGIAAWNVAAHFYPHWSLVSTDWEAHLRAWLRAQPATQTRAEMRNALRALVAPLDDGHATIVDPKEPRRHFLPISIRPLAQGWVVDASNTERVRAGDVIVAVDGKPAAAWFAERMALVSGSPQRKRWAVASELVSGAKDSAVALRLQRGNANVDVKLARESERGLGSPRAAPLAEIRPGIHYVDAARFDKAAFDKALPALAKARGIVFDLRGYPARDAHLLAAYWIAEKDPAQWMFVPRYDRPFAQADTAWSIGWQKEKDAALASAAKVALVDARTIDYAESLAAYFPAQRAGALLGETTAGANGNPARATLPSGMYFFFTSMRVTRHDGSTYHREGLKADEVVVPTLAGIAARRDEALERAISHIEKNAPR